MHCPLFEGLGEVGPGGGLLLWMDKVEEGLSGEELCLIFEMACEDGVEVNEV